MFISNNRGSFHLRWKEKVVVEKNFVILFLTKSIFSNLFCLFLWSIWNASRVGSKYIQKQHSRGILRKRQLYCNVTLLKSHFGMGVLLKICCIISEHLSLRTPLEGCFCISKLAKACLPPCQTSLTVLFTKIINAWKQWTTLANRLHYTNLKIFRNCFHLFLLRTNNDHRGVFRTPLEHLRWNFWRNS